MWEEEEVELVSDYLRHNSIDALGIDAFLLLDYKHQMPPYEVVDSSLSDVVTVIINIKKALGYISDLCVRSGG